VGYRSCFYRKIPEESLRQDAAPDRVIELEFTETEKVFDPEEVYPGVPNPTKL
jgi:phosphoribosyl-AMP cyclohydrolase